MKENHPKNAEIINGIISLNSQVYEYLDARYYQKVIQHVKHNSGSKEDGEELYQDVIFELYLKFGQDNIAYNDSINFEQFFWMIIKRRWIDVLRKRRKNFKLTALQDIAVEIASNDLDSTREKEIQHSLIIALNKSLNKLSKEEVEYIELYYFAKKSLKFIADNFGISYDYARLKLHRIRDKLRKMIDSDPEFKILTAH